MPVIVQFCFKCTGSFKPCYNPVEQALFSHEETETQGGCCVSLSPQEVAASMGIMCKVFIRGNIRVEENEEGAGGGREKNQTTIHSNPQ